MIYTVYPPQSTASINALQTVASLQTIDATKISCEVQVTNAPLTAFQILGRIHPSGTYQLLYSTVTDYTAPKGMLIWCSGDLTTKAIGSGSFVLDATTFESIQIKAAGIASGITILFSAR